MKDLDAIYLAAREMSKEQRVSYLDGACDGDEGVKARILEMLGKSNDAEAFFGESGEDVPTLLGGTQPPGGSTEITYRDVPREIGHYAVGELIGAGGMGRVYQGRDTRLGRSVAIKILPAAFINDSTSLERFKREAQVLASLNHPNIATIHGFEEAGDIKALVLELVEGKTLAERIKPANLELEEALPIFRQIAEALEAAHQKGIIHRDLKPANIGLDVRGHVKVLDFGLAKRMSREGGGVGETSLDSEQTQSGQVMGTPLFMSPEQALGKDIDHRTDIFSMGVVMYRVTTGQLPFNGDNFGEVVNKVVHSQPVAIARLNYDVPPELERIILKCLQKSRDNRYQSVGEMVIDLRNLGRELEYGGPVSRSSAFPISDGKQIQPEPITLETIQSSPVLLSYAPVDDQPLMAGKPGWVSELHRNLEVRVEQLSGEKVSIARLPGNSDSAVFDAGVLDYIPKAKAMISVVSPPFFKSEACRREVETFWRGADVTGGRWVEDKARLLKVLKTSIASEEMPPQLADIFSPLFGFEFFEVDSRTGRVREFDEAFGPALKQRFFERVYDLAYDVCHILKRFQQSGSHEIPSADANPNRRWIYLASTTSDVQDERDRIRRELSERGHMVLPDGPLPMLSREVEASVGECLEKCSIAIHLLGRHYGVTPEDSSESIPALQLRLTATHSRRQNLERLVWMPGGDDAQDHRQREFLRRVQEDPELHHNAELIEGNLNLLKKDLIRRLEPPEEKPKAPVVAAKASKGAPKLYLICDPKDEANLEMLEDYLFDQGFEVCLPAFDGDDLAAAELHQDNLLTCDAVLVYYGEAPRAWVDIKLRELLKAAGYGRETPIAVQGVYIAPPEDRRKERYRSHQAQVIHQGADFAPGDELNAFIAQVKEVRA